MKRFQEIIFFCYTSNTRGKDWHPRNESIFLHVSHTHRSTHCWLQSPPTAVGLGWKVGTKSAPLCNTTNPYLCSSDPLTLTAASQILRWSPKASNKKLLQMQMSQFCWLRQELLQPSQPTTDPPSYHFFFIVVLNKKQWKHINCL